VAVEPKNGVTVRVDYGVGEDQGALYVGMSQCPKADRQCLKNSQQLAEQGPCWHHHWIGTTETINRYERKVNYRLKNMLCVGVMLEVGQRLRQSSVAKMRVVDTLVEVCAAAADALVGNS
jgi:hypothetical protein